ncbi:MAG: hypothetical protein LBV74_21615 [Tannerella sp.]|jgi:hypothetical protein|nr:hypothetical protein [Tannerella sp.]
MPHNFIHSIIYLKRYWYSQKIDKNIHIHIHGNRDVVEPGEANITRLIIRKNYNHT